MSTEIKERENVQNAEQKVYRKPWFTSSQSEDSYVVEVSIPGVSKNGVEIGYEDETLDIVAHRSDTQIPEGWKALRREISREDYRLRLQLNVPVDAEKITASVEDGVLTLTLPKAEEAKPRTIQVQ